MLDVHPPHHPTHTWRDFFIHIATIVIGLIIAIGLEQTVEFFHHRHQLQKAREELRDEIQSNRSANAKQMAYLHQVQAELHTDMTLLLAHRMKNTPLTAPLRFDWDFWRTRSAAWDTNKQSGALSLMPHPELAHYDYIFTVCNTVMDSAGTWQASLETAKAIATRASDGTLSPQDTNELITAISDTQGKLARTERLITFAKGALDDHTYDN
jgi:hypothetical protein